MGAMIPHQFLATLTREQARISDPQAKKLADDTIAAQRSAGQ
jgi:uncharacterized protein (DUF305 family)